MVNAKNDKWTALPRPQPLAHGPNLSPISTLGLRPKSQAPTRGLISTLGPRPNLNHRPTVRF